MKVLLNISNKIKNAYNVRALALIALKIRQIAFLVLIITIFMITK
jgi:hypothetical protein